MFDDVRVSTMLLTAAVFLAMIVVLNAMFYKPLLKFMDDRSDSIKNDENKVKDNSREILGVNDELENIHKNTREEIHRIKQNAINLAKQEAQQEFKVKKEELERKMVSFHTDLRAQRQELKENLVANLPRIKQALQSNLRKGLET